MPNHTMFPKYSRKKEIRVHSCQGFVSALRKGNIFLSPTSPWHQQTNETGCLLNS